MNDDSPHNINLPESEKTRIRAEELFRMNVIRELSPPPKHRSPMLDFLNSTLGIWFLSTCVVGVITFAYNHQKELAQKRNEQAKAVEAKAEHQKQEVLDATHRNASMVTLLLPYLTSDEEKKWRIAIEVTKYLKQNGQLPPELESALEGIVKTDDLTGNLAGELDKRIAAATVLDAVAAPKQVVASSLSSLPPRIYIQISSEAQRDVANKLRALLNRSSYLAPGIENASGKATFPDSTELRYFRADEHDEAVRLVGLMRQVTPFKKKPLLVNLKNANRPRHYEVWFDR